MKKAIAKIMLDEGYVKAVENTVEDDHPVIKITLKYLDKKQPVIQGMRRISKPGLRIYASCEELPRVLGGLGVAIISTNRGVMTDKKARTENVGGEVLCYIW
jgi:small subunit ribosomal protein S8